MSTSSRYLGLQPSYTIDLNEGHQQELYDHHQLLLHQHNTTLVNFSRFESVSQDQIGYLYMGSQLQPLQPSPYHQEVDNFGLYDKKALEINKGGNHTSLKFTLYKKEDQIVVGEIGGGSDGGAEISGSSVNWMPLRLMKKVMRGGDDQKEQLPPVQVEAETRHLIRNALIGGSPNVSSSCNNNNDNTTIRACLDCNTTKTPLWRSGPRGPKTLCNACGIRQRKARRMMALATNGSLIPNSMSGSSTMRAENGHKKASNNNNVIGAQKKRSKIVKPSREHQHNGPQRKLCFEKFALNLSKKLSLQQVFPQEEKEAAILLMALSCGLFHG